MGLEDEEFTCDAPPRGMTPRAARAYWSEHSSDSCLLAAAARAVLDGEPGLPWSEVNELHTVTEWAAAYANRGIPVAVRSGGGGVDGVDLVADDAVTVVLAPAGLAAAAYDEVGGCMPTLATFAPYVPSRRWAVLIEHQDLPDDVRSVLGECHIDVLRGGERIALPSQHPDDLHWWYEWPRGRPGELYCISLVVVANSLLRVSGARQSLTFDGREIGLRYRWQRQQCTGEPAKTRRLLPGHGPHRRHQPMAPTRIRAGQATPASPDH
ncbi:hypothetical protein [Nocardia sp. CDC160]|uniref:hypothetical protein n=1 Tax=Nocardia sp. CDC160 TaxID=3112166 RepID=UPI002DBDB71A|nr:hypothetical protein [Nocardia sp. CDC160]MEC3919229.1 hypothetical protein [Nocardia sp. CDC160]